MLKALLHKIIQALSSEEIESFLKEHHNRSEAQYIKIFQELRELTDVSTSSIKNTDRALYYLEEVLLSHICHLKPDHIDYYYTIGVFLREHHLLKESLSYMELSLENYKRYEYFSKCILVIEELLTYYYLPIYNTSKLKEVYEKRIQYRLELKHYSQLIDQEQQLQSTIDQISIFLLTPSDKNTSIYTEALKALYNIQQNSFHARYLYLIAMHNIPDATPNKPISCEQAIDTLGELFMQTQNHRGIYGMMLAQILKRQYYYKLLNDKNPNLEHFITMIDHIENKKIEIKRLKQFIINDLQTFQLFYQEKNIIAAKSNFFKKAHLDLLKLNTSNYHTLMLPVSILLINEDYKELVNFMRYYEEYLTQGETSHSLSFKTILLVAYMEIDHSKKEYYFDQLLKELSDSKHSYLYTYLQALESIHKSNTEGLTQTDKNNQLKKHQYELKNKTTDALLVFWDKVNILDIYLSAKLNKCSNHEAFKTLVPTTPILEA